MRIDDKRSEDHHIALLIDADNTSYKYAKYLISEISKFGRAVVKRIYGDWSKAELKGWANILNEYAIVPVQQGRYTIGKNATDSRMIIDAMDLLYSERYDAFAIVSSDSDFTALASRLRESGLTVYGFGMQKTPKPFVNTCDVFRYFEAIAQESSESAPMTTVDPLQDSRLMQVIHTGVDELSEEDGFVNLSKLQRYIIHQIPDFDPRNYGFFKLRYLIKHLNVFEMDFRGPKDNPKQIIYIGKKKKWRSERDSESPASNALEIDNPDFNDKIRIESDDSEVVIELYATEESELPTGEERNDYNHRRNRSRRKRISIPPKTEISPSAVPLQAQQPSIPSPSQNQDPPTTDEIPKTKKARQSRKKGSSES